MGDACDTAMCQGFSLLEAERLDRRRFRFQAEARMAASAHVEAFHDPVRRHSALGCRPPVQNEKDHARTARMTTAHHDPEPST